MGESVCCRALNSDDATQLFFHISEVIPPSCDTGKATDLRNILKTGDEVQFTIRPSRTDGGKLHAKRVRKLACGTINPEEVDPTIRRGCVRCDHNGDLYIAPWEEHATVEGHAQLVKKLKFSRQKNVRPGSKPPQVDDVVEFNIAIDKIRGSKRAKNIEVIAEAPSEQSMQGREVVRHN
jgi:cold shock CspA family protein